MKPTRAPDMFDALRARAEIASKRGLVAAMLIFGTSGCFSGGELNEKEPPPGEVGGVCLNGGCNAGQCLNTQICFEPTDPCKGIYCGGHGTCFQDLDNGNLPICVCDAGYQNSTYSYFCTAGA